MGHNTTAPSGKPARKRQKKPDFVVRESNFSARVKKRWRYPQGRHSAVRQMHRGRPAMPHPGYGAPKELRGMHPSGYWPVVVHNLAELLALNPDRESAIIASTVGMKKKKELLNAAGEKRIHFINVKDSAKLLTTIESKVEQRKKVRLEYLKKKGEKEEEKRKKAEEKKKEEKVKEAGAEKSGESVEDKLKEEEKKQKEIMEKTIIQRQ